MIPPTFMHKALSSSLAAVTLLALVTSLGCATHDRRNYTTHRDKGLRTPDPWAPSPAKVADEATSPLMLPLQPGVPAGITPPVAPLTAPAPATLPAPAAAPAAGGG
jgi:hypothetical protein